MVAQEVQMQQIAYRFLHVSSCFFSFSKSHNIWPQQEPLRLQFDVKNHQRGGLTFEARPERPKQVWTEQTVWSPGAVDWKIFSKKRCRKRCQRTEPEMKAKMIEDVSQAD